MAKIENKVAYPLVKPQSNDYVVLTDVSDNNATKTCLVGDLFNFFGWKTFSRTLLASEILAAEATPIILIPAQGPGVIVMPEIGQLVAMTITQTAVPPVQFNCANQAWIKTPLTAPYGSTNIYALDQDNVNNAQPGYPSNTVYGSRTNTGGGAPDDNTYGGTMSPMVNQPIIFTFDAGDGPTLGNGAITVTFRYRVLTGFNL